VPELDEAGHVAGDEDLGVVRVGVVRPVEEAERGDGQARRPDVVVDERVDEVERRLPVQLDVAVGEADREQRPARVEAAAVDGPVAVAASWAGLVRAWLGEGG